MRTSDIAQSSRSAVSTSPAIEAALRPARMNPSNAENSNSANSVTTCASAHTSDFHENNTRPDSTTSAAASMLSSMLGRAWCNDTAHWYVPVSSRAVGPHLARHLVQKGISQTTPITVALLLHTWGCLHFSTWSGSKVFDPGGTTSCHTCPNYLRPTGKFQTVRPRGHSAIAMLLVEEFQS